MKASLSKSTFKFPVSSSVGEVSAEIFEPENAKAMMALAHGAGAGMNHPFMRDLSAELAAQGIGTMRFNFPYVEAKKKRPDVPAVAQRTIEAAITHLNNKYPSLPLFAGGKSFGGRMTSQKIAEAGLSNIKALIFFGFPLHAPGKPSTERALHLKSIRIPMLFLQGTRDALADLNLITETVTQLDKGTLVTFEGADHSFKAGKNIIVAELAARTAQWLRERKLM